MSIILDEPDSSSTIGRTATKKNTKKGNRILIHDKWKGSSWIRDFDDIGLLSDSGTCVDFLITIVDSHSIGVLLLTEDDYIGDSKVYRQRLAKFYHEIKNKDWNGVVLGIRSSDLIDTSFAAVQSFSVIDLGLNLIPLKEISNVVQILVQLSTTASKVNPFKFGVAKEQIEPSQKRIIETISTIWGLGVKRARLLLETFGTIKEISEKSIQDMTPIIGASSAKSVFQFFNAKRQE